MSGKSNHRRETNLLTLVPERIRDYIEREDGLVDVIVPRFGDGRIARMLEIFVKRTPIYIKLDEIGTMVWRLCDGTNSVRDIGERMERELGDKIEPVYDRLNLFFREMELHKLIRWKNIDVVSGSTREKGDG